MKIGILGGTFNPPHNAHLQIAELAGKQYGLDRIIFITSGNPPHKDAMVSAKHRFNMTRLAIESNAAFCDDDFEINRLEKSYTLHTLEYLKQKYPTDEMFFIIGEDSLEDLPKWYKPDRILKLANLLVFARTQDGSLQGAIKIMRGKYGENIFPIDSPVIGISSTDIRKRIKNGETVRDMVPDRVIQYIEENGLYV